MWILICSALVLVISLIDYYSGPDLTVSLFYFAVIVLYSWKTAVRRQATIADVDTHDEEPAINEAVAELFSPVEHLAAQPTDQHQWRIVLESEGVVEDTQVS